MPFIQRRGLLYEGTTPTTDEDPMLHALSKKAKKPSVKSRYPLPDFSGPYPQPIPAGEGDLPDEVITKAVEELFRARAAAPQKP